MYRKENQVIAEIIELYRSESCLWKLKIPEYHDRTRKDAAYDKQCEKSKFNGTPSKLILWTEE